MVASLSKAMSQTALEQYHSKDNYYIQNEGLENSQWQGRFSAEQGLDGPITAQQWQQACRGQDPAGNELRRKQTNSRAGWDITLSACKSASLKALVDPDDRVLAAHRQAVLATVDYIEQNCIFAQIKVAGKLQREQTQRGQFALFEHDDNRKQEPQLHTHIVILNQTPCADGKTRTLDSRELFIQKKTIGAYYDHAFAHQLQQQGFKLDWTSDHTFEISGYQKQQLEAFSGRRQQIREHLEKQQISLEQATEQQKAIACLESRPVKLHKLHPIDHIQQRQCWQQESAELGIIHPQPDLEQQYDLPSHPGSLNQVIQAGIESATTQRVALSRQELLRECLRHSQAAYAPVNVAQALLDHPDLIPLSDGRVTTTQVLAREQQMIDAAQSSQNTQLPLADLETIQAIAQVRGLNPGQKAGLTHIATSTDQITLLQGDAGVGKTYTMQAFKDCLNPDQQARLQGLAPSAAAAETLTNEAGITASTIDYYLLKADAVPQQILLVDEAGMISADQMARLIQKVQDLDSRLILVGDTKQLSPIAAGAPFRLLQDYSPLTTLAIAQNLRQTEPRLFAAASLSAQQRTNEGLKQLDEFGCLQEITNPQHRNQALVEHYLAGDSRTQARTLILCDTNADRRQITDQLRAAYLDDGTLSRQASTIQILYPKRLDKLAIRQAYHYRPGDVIRFDRPSRQFPDLYYRVAAVTDSTLSLKDRAGQIHSLPLHRYPDRAVFECQPLELRVGDRLRFTRNHRAWNQTNGQPYTIEALNPDQTIEIRTKGQRYTLTPDQLLHSDYAYCRTVYSAQGWTSAAALWAPSQHPGQEQTYVVLTRAKESLHIFTLDRQALLTSAQQSQAQENATELVHPAPSHTYPGMADLAAAVQEFTEQQAIADEPRLTQQLADLTERVRLLNQNLTDQQQVMQRLLTPIAPDSLTAAPQQLTLFPIQTDEPKWPPIQQQRSPASQRRTSPEPRSSPEPDQQAPHPTSEKSAAAAQSPPLDPAAPTGSRLAELAAAFGQLADQLDPSRAAASSGGAADPTEQRNHPEPAPDLRELHHQRPPDQPAAPELRASTAESDRPAAPPRSPDQLGSEPSQTTDSPSGEPAQPDPSPAERAGAERQSSLDYPSLDQPQRQSAQFAADLQRVEQQIHPAAGADEWTDEQPGDSTEEIAEALSLTETEVDPGLAIAQMWSDPDLLAIAQRVQTYFQQPPPEPDWQLGEQLQTAWQQLDQQTQAQAQVFLQRQQELERLGVRRSWHHPFGTPAPVFDAAVAQSDLARLHLATLKRQLNQTRQTFLDWQKPAQRYHEWRYSELGEQMHQVKAVLDLEPVQERLAQLHHQQERMQRQQQGLQVLQAWQEMAIALNQPAAYRQRIQEVTAAYQQGEPLSQREKQALQQDVAAYQVLQEQQQQRQREQDQGFCL
jgi:conjugative relaxase-like TrwC/TraI family protein